MSDPPAIEVNELKKRFGDVEAVRGVSFTVAPGEIFGFLGPNGAGKTTTIKMLCTLLTPSSGTARLGGFNVVSQAAEVRKRIGIIFQDPSLDDRLTALENLELHAVAYGVPRAERASRIDEALRFVELNDRRTDLVRTFSGGMKRRLEIARSLVHNPRILFLDEPTTGLDPQTRRRTWEVLRELRKRHTMTLFLTTHYMEEAEGCDRIAIIDHGQIVAQGTPEALKREVGKDVVRVRTSAPDELARILEERHGITPDRDGDGLRFHTDDGEALLVALIAEARPLLGGIAVDRPTLDDVFVSITGRQIRAQEADARDVMRAAARSRR
jgi:ABC-2 type transport system ATP-binding protein